MKRGVFSKLNLHLFLLAVVIGADIFLGVRFGLAWRAIRSDQSAAFLQQEARLAQLESQMSHLNGLPKKVDAADVDAEKFYDARIAPNYSTILAQTGAIETKSNVKQSRASYTENPASRRPSQSIEPGPPRESRCCSCPGAGAWSCSVATCPRRRHL